MGSNNPRNRKVEQDGPAAPAVPDSAAPAVPEAAAPAVPEASAVPEVPAAPEVPPTAVAAAEADVEWEEESAPIDPSVAERHAEARRNRVERTEKKERKKRRNTTIRRLILFAIFLVVVAFGALVISFNLYRWQTFDDVADIQGIWYHENSTLPVTVTAEEIELTDGVAYRYTIDPEAKTIVFRFGNMEGGGRYRFSLDRTRVAITDGTFEWMDNYLTDLVWTAQSVLAEYFVQPALPLAGDDEKTTIFVRSKPAETATSNTTQ